MSEVAWAGPFADILRDLSSRYEPRESIPVKLELNTL